MYYFLFSKMFGLLFQTDEYGTRYLTAIFLCTSIQFIIVCCMHKIRFDYFCTLSLIKGQHEATTKCGITLRSHYENGVSGELCAISFLVNTNIRPLFCFFFSEVAQGFDYIDVFSSASNSGSSVNV